MEYGTRRVSCPVGAFGDAVCCPEWQCGIVVFFLSMLVLWVQALPGRALHASSFFIQSACFVRVVIKTYCSYDFLLLWVSCRLLLSGVTTCISKVLYTATEKFVISQQRGHFQITQGHSVTTSS